MFVTIVFWLTFVTMGELAKWAVARKWAGEAASWTSRKGTPASSAAVMRTLARRPVRADYAVPDQP